jgi:hypothetical protein
MPENVEEFNSASKQGRIRLNSSTLRSSNKFSLTDSIIEEKDLEFEQSPNNMNRDIKRGLELEGGTSEVSP